MLGARLALHDLDDVERLASRALDDALRRRGIVLDYHRREDALAYLVAELWLASRRFDSTRYPSFRTLANTVVRRRVVDWLRADLGRTTWKFGDHVYERELPKLVSFDAPGGSELEGAHGGEQGDFEAGRADLEWALTH